MKSLLFFVLIKIHRDNTILGSMVVPTHWGAQTELEMSMDCNRILKVKATPPPPNKAQRLKISNLGVCIVWCFCWTIKSYTLFDDRATTIPTTLKITWWIGLPTLLSLNLHWLGWTYTPSTTSWLSPDPSVFVSSDAHK